MKLKPCLLCLLITALLACGNSLPSPFNLPDSTDIAEISSALTSAEPRQMGLIGFTALGAMMFPILVSLGMASFVSHLPTVFKEFASEFGIPSTPPRKFFLFKRKLFNLRRTQDFDLDRVIDNFQRRFDQIPAADENFMRHLYGRSKR